MTAADVALRRVQEAAAWAEEAARRMQDARWGAVVAQIEAAEAEVELWRAVARHDYLLASPLTEQHPYMKALGLDGVPLRGLRADAEGWLLVPMWKDRTLVGLLRVSENGREEIPDPSCYPLGERTFSLGPEITALTVLCPEIESAWLASRAIPDARVVATFDSNSLGVVRSRTKGTVIVTTDDLRARYDELCAAPLLNKWGTPNTKKANALAAIRSDLMMRAGFQA